MGLRNQLRRLERTLRGQRSSFERQDGSTYWYDEGEVWSTVFRHGTVSLDADYKGEPRPKPPDVLKAVVKPRTTALLWSGSMLRAALRSMQTTRTHLSSVASSCRYHFSPAWNVAKSISSG